MKKILLSVLILALVLCTAGCSLSEDIIFDTDTNTLKPGTYDNGNLIKNWEDLVREGIMSTTGECIHGRQNELIGDLVLPNTVKNVSDYAFQECKYLTGITIPEGVTKIGYRAFQYCKNLARVKIPASVAAIDPYAFFFCTGLENLTIAEGNSTYHSTQNCIIETESKTLLIGSKNSVIPSDGSVTSIGNYAFSPCHSLTNINIPNNITSIGIGAFSDCVNLASVTFDENSQLTSIGSSAFYSCTSLTSINIPNRVTSIGDGAFSRCADLASIAIPAGIIAIDFDAFSDCSSLTNVTIPDSVTSISGFAFGGGSGFSNHSKLENIIYLGTVEQWKAVQLEAYWMGGAPAKEIVCSDGSVPIT